MAGLDQYSKDPEHANWVKNTQALKIVLDVLKPYVHRELPHIQTSVINKGPLGVTCVMCNVSQAPKCPNNVCNIYYKEIIDNHRRARPSFGNTNANKWKTDAWEIAKCFIPQIPGNKYSSSSDSDFSAVINIIINCRHFDSLVSCDLDNGGNEFIKARRMRNELMHSYSLKVSETDVEENLDLLISLMSCFKDTLQDSPEAVKQIIKLKTGELQITLNDVDESRKQARRAVFEESSETEEKLREFVDRHKAHFKQEEEATTSIRKAPKYRHMINFIEGCKYSLISLIETVCQSVKPDWCPHNEWNFKEFLKRFEQFTEVQSLFDRHKILLYPEDGSSSDIKKWDIFLLCHVLTLKKGTNLSNHVVDYIKEIKIMRDKILDNPNSITEEDLKILSSYLDEPLRTEVTRKFTGEYITNDEVHLLLVLKLWQQNEDNIHIKQIHREDLERDEQLARRIEALERWIEKFEKDQDNRKTNQEVAGKPLRAEIQNQNDQIYEEREKFRNSRSTAFLNEDTIDTCVVVEPKNVDPEEEKQLQENITSKDRDKNVSIANGGLNYFKTKEKIDNACMVEGSIILKVTCKSIDQLIRFWDSCMDGSAVRAFAKIRDDYREFLGCSTLDFDLVLTKKEVHRCINHLVDRLSSRLPDKSILEEIKATWAQSVSEKSQTYITRKARKDNDGDDDGDFDDDDEEEEEEEKEEEKPTSIVKVKGLTKIKSLDAVHYYFENHRRSGGGNINDISHHGEDEDIAFITFCDPQVAENVVSRKHKVEGQSLQVSLHVPPKSRPFYKDKILIKGLQSTTTEDCLFKFLEANSGSVPVALQRGEKEGVVLVTFKSRPDFEKLSEICAKLPLEGAMLQLSKVQVSNCIIVFNIPDDTSTDTIRFHFENTRRSDGGPVDKVVMKEEECYCLVYFVEYSAVDKVLAKKHVVGDNVLTVKLYLECLGCSTSDVMIHTPIKLPDVIVIHDVEPSKLKFVRQSQSNRDAIIRQMNDVNANIIWPDKDFKAKDIMINCTLTPQTANVRKLVKSWKEATLKKFEDFMRNIVVARHDVIQEFWNPVMEKIKSLQITNPDAAVLLADKDQCIISVVGLKQTVEIVSRDITDYIKKVADEGEKEKQKVKETLTVLKSIETKMLLAKKFPSKMKAKYPSLKLKINQKKNKISFGGRAVDIKAAKIDMFETKEKYAKASVDMSGCRSFFSLYETKQAKDYIVKELKNNNLTAVWEVNDKTLTVYSTCDESARKSLELIKNCVVENRIGLTVENSVLLETKYLQTVLDKQKQKYPGKVDFEVQQKAVYVCSTADIVDEVLETVKKNKKTIIKDEITLSKQINRLFEKHHKNEIAKISRKYTSPDIQIYFKRDNAGFILRGPREDVNEIKNELHNLKYRVIIERHIIERPGLMNYMKSRRGKEHINTVEEKHHVVIDSQDSDDKESFYQNKSYASKDLRTIRLRIHAECIAYGVRKIYSAEGDITDLPVDVLVNTIDSKLNPTGSLSKAICIKGGIQFQYARKNFNRDDGELDVVEAFLSPAGNLKAKHIVHIVEPTRKPGPHYVERVLHDSVLKAMKKASDKNMKSVALPNISYGVYRFPVKMATRIIVQAVLNFFNRVQDSTIKEVYLCDMNVDTVEMFTEALMEEIGDSKVSKLRHIQLSVKSKVVPRKQLRRRRFPDHSLDNVEYATFDECGISAGIVKDEVTEESAFEAETKTLTPLERAIRSHRLLRVKSYLPVLKSVEDRPRTDLFSDQGEPNPYYAFSSGMSDRIVKDEITEESAYEAEKKSFTPLERDSRSQKPRHLTSYSTVVKSAEHKPRTDLFSDQGEPNPYYAFSSGMSDRIVKDEITEESAFEAEKKSFTPSKRESRSHKPRHLTSYSAVVKSAEHKPRTDLFSDKGEPNLFRALSKEISDRIVKDESTEESTYRAENKLRLFRQETMRTPQLRQVRPTSAMSQYVQGPQSRLPVVSLLEDYEYPTLATCADATIEQRPKSSLYTGMMESRRFRYDSKNRFIIWVYSLCMENIVAAIESLEDIISHTIKREFFDEAASGNLQEQHTKSLLQRSKELCDPSRFLQRTRSHSIGTTHNVRDASSYIHGRSRELDRSEYEKKEAMQLTQIVQWFFIDITDEKQELVKYDPSVNLLIETAFKSGEPKVEFSDNEGTNHIIDFTQMEEYAVYKPKHVVNVIRRDLMIVETEETFKTPHSWAYMGKDNVKTITLQNTDKEYLDVAAAFTNSVNNPNFEVSKIYRIQNTTLWTQYHAKKKRLDETNRETINERVLWHGTSVDAVDNINAFGFNRSYCETNVTAFGDGVYFAVNASYSRPDSTGIKRMYMCRVLTGEYTTGKRGMRVPPPKAGGATSSVYDSVVNNVASPTMFIIFHDTQAYPEYLILFKKKV